MRIDDTGMAAFQVTQEAKEIAYTSSLAKMWHKKEHAQ